MVTALPRNLILPLILLSVIGSTTVLFADDQMGGRGRVVSPSNQARIPTVAKVGSERIDEEEVPRSLDFDLRKAENYRIELTPNGGEYFGDKLNHSFVVGQNIQWNLTPGLGIQADFGWSKASADRTSLLGQGIRNDNLYILSGGFVVTKPAAYQSKNHVVEMDFFTSIGGGAVLFNQSESGMGFIGGGIKTRFKKVPWLALKVDFRENLFSIPNPGGSDFASDATLTFGPTFMFGVVE